AFVVGPPLHEGGAHGAGRDECRSLCHAFAVLSSLPPDAKGDEVVQRPRLMPVSALFLLFPSVTMAQGITIQHDPIGCVVAGRFPKITACFAPAASVARARVYFKAETGPDWYWVEFPTGAPCPTAILPKP